jgi:hypothetical protein
MAVPRHLVSVAEVVVVCKWWKPVRKPDRRGWVNHYGLAECTPVTWCKYNTTDARLGGCIISGNISKISREERP